MGISVNFDGVEAQQGGGPIAEGKYMCVIHEAKETTSQQGTPGVEVVFRIVGGDFDGRFIWDRIWFTQKAMGMARWKVECTGMVIPAGAWTLEPSALVNRRVEVTVRHEEYDGKTQAKVKGWDPAGNAQPATAANGDDIPF